MRGERLFEPFFDRAGVTWALRHFILDELGAPTRRWHGLFHHALMLRAITRAKHGERETRQLILATLFHDIVYDPTRADNEERSADVSREWLWHAQADTVAALILATKHHDLHTDPVTRTLLEADLAVLWTPSARLYAFYADGIRAEYVHVPADAYRTGRAAVLRQLGARLVPFLDSTRAACLRRNLNGEIARL